MQKENPAPAGFSFSHASRLTHGMLPRMRALLVLILLFSPLVWADAIYREVQADGSVHFTDRPADKRARPMNLQLPPGSSSRPQKGAMPVNASELLRQAARYSVRVESPTPEQIHGNGHKLVAAASVMPGLVKGFQLVYQVDGAAVTDAPVDQLSVVLPQMAAGLHTLVVVLLDPKGQEVARSSPTRFQLLEMPAIGQTAQK